MSPAAALLRRESHAPDEHSGSEETVGKTHDEIKLRIATIKRGDRGHAENKKVTWARLRDRLSTPEIDKRHTLPEYRELSIDRQNKLKDVGSFVGGPFRDGLRKNDHLIERSIVTLDIDEASPEQIDILRMGLSEVCQFEFFGSTTRKHTKKKPRWRLVFPLARPVTVEEYAPLARILASTLFLTESESMDAVDDVSYRAAQVMYWPSICKDALFETIDNRGRLLDPDAVLDDFGDWHDWTLLPFSEKRGQKRPTTGKKAEDPREKKGLIGAFCRAYDIEDAIEAFLPDIYVLGDPNSNKPRYTYVHGSSSNGAVVEDDGLFLYSHHGTDPCGDRLVNAFDLVRIHLFGELDHDAPEDARPTELPSYEEMKRLVRKDDAVQAQFDDDYGDYAEPEFDDLGESEDDEPDRDEKREKPDRNRDDRPEREEKGDEGPDMSLLKPSRHAAPAFPVDVLGPFWAKRAEIWAENGAAPVDYTAMAILTGAAATIGNSRWVSPKPGWKEPPVLWCAIVGPPSANKSPALGPLSSVLADLEASWLPQYNEALREYETDKKQAVIRRRIWEQDAQKALEDAEPFPGEDEDLIGTPRVPQMPIDCMDPERPVRRRVVMNDATLESLLKTHGGNPRGLMSMRDEMTSWFANMSRYNNGSDRPAWLEAYGGRPYTVDRVKDDGKPTHIRHFSVSILGGIQPDRLRELLTSTDDGLQARFMYAWPDATSRPLTEGIEEDNGAALALRELSELEMDVDVRGQHNPVVLPLSRKAWLCFQKWVNDRKRDEKFAYPALQGAFGKADGLVIRIALVLEHLWWAANTFESEGPPEKVSLRAIKAAIRLREEYIKPMQVRTFAHAGKTENERLGALLANWIATERPKRVNTREIVRGRIFGLSETKQVAAAIEYLVEANWLSPAETSTGKRGRPKRDFTVNKSVYQNLKTAETA